MKRQSLEDHHVGQVMVLEVQRRRLAVLNQPLVVVAAMDAVAGNKWQWAVVLSAGSSCIGLATLFAPSGHGLSQYESVCLAYTRPAG
jgi:hypothetical protein